jgi:hypothetical protein
LINVLVVDNDKLERTVLISGMPWFVESWNKQGGDKITAEVREIAK